MKKNSRNMLCGIVALLCLLGLYGCGSKPESSKKPEATFSVMIQTEPPEQLEESTEPEITEAPGIRPEFKEAMDSYEEFYDGYCEFLRKYKENPTDYTLLAEYADMLSKAEEMEEKFNAWDESDLTNEELKYYLDVTTRIQKKMIDLSSDAS